MLRRLLSYLARFTPNTVYYSPTLRINLNNSWRDIQSRCGEERHPILGAAFHVAITAKDMEPRETYTIELWSAEHGGEVIGDYVVTVTRRA